MLGHAPDQVIGMKPLAVVIDFTTSLAGLSEAFCWARKQPDVKLWRFDEDAP